MRLAIVFDAPRALGSHAGRGGAYLDRVLESCVAYAGHPMPEMQDFYSVSVPQPGGRPPPIADVRDERERLLLELEAWQPDRILSIGASALNALSPTDRVLTISKERGRMRYLSRSRTLKEVPWLPTISHMAVIRASDLHRDFTNDVYKVLTQPAPIPALPIEVAVMTARTVMAGNLHLMDDATVVSVDLETTGLSPYRDQVIAVGIGAIYQDDSGETGGLAAIIPNEILGIPMVLDKLDEFLWSRQRRTVGHNFKFDHQFLARLIGSWAPDNALVGDTLLLAHLMDERPNRPTSRVRGLGLKDIVATKYDHAYGFDFDEFYDSKDKDWAALYTYLAQDACYTALLWHDLEAEDPEMVEVHDRLLVPISRAIAQCELGGAPVDRRWVSETLRAFDRRIARRQRVVEDTIVCLAPTMVVDNVMSPQQVADVMYDEWGMTPDVRKHGKIMEDDRSTDKDHVRAAVSKYLGTGLDRQAKWLRALERLRRDVKTRTTYQKSILERLDTDGRVRASFLIHGTSTGRLSSQGPNLQNVPAVDRQDSSQYRPMRRAFRPAGGKLWVEVDYSQLELRVAAALSQDEALTEVFRSGRDVHLEVATAIFSKPPDQISKAERFLAKAVGFGIIYGRGPRALASGAEMRYVEQRLGGKAWTEEQADAFTKKFLRTYPDLAAWMDRLHQEVPAIGYVESPFGRRRRFPLTPGSRGELGAIQRQAVNTPVQSAASDICLLAMAELQDEIIGMDARVLFPVHDSICLEAAPEFVGPLEVVCRTIMEKEFMGVPLTVDFEYGPTWADVGSHQVHEPSMERELGSHERR